MRSAALLACAAALCGCAATGAIYQKLDWFAAWRLDDYVSLDRAQKERFDRDFNAAWRWHRAEQLPLYARDLREIAVRLEKHVTPQQVGAYSQRFEQHWENTMAALLPGTCALVSSFSDRQAREVLDELDDNIDKFAAKYVEPPEQELRRNSRKRFTRWITHWTGDLNGAQESILDRWERERRSIGADWLAYRREWRKSLDVALARRDSKDACRKIEPLMVRPLALRGPRLAESLGVNEKLWRQMIADLINAQDPKQRSTTVERVLETAGQLEELSRRPP